MVSNPEQWARQVDPRSYFNNPDTFLKGIDKQVVKDKLKEHMDSPFYKVVSDYVNEIAVEQIAKGAEKYPEPFNPDSWTNDELANHAMQENRDQAVYITGMRERMRNQSKYIDDLEASAEYYKLRCMRAEEVLRQMDKQLQAFKIHYEVK